MLYRDALWAVQERSVGARVLTAVSVVTFPVVTFGAWLFALPSEVQTICLLLFAGMTGVVGLDVGRAAWKRSQAALAEAQQALVEGRRYKTTVAADLEALGQRLYKRTTEWWVASMAGRRIEADTKRAEADVVMQEINAKLTAEVSAVDAGYFRRPRAHEPFRPTMEGLPDGNWINEMWHRVNRLDEIIDRLRWGPPRAGA